MFNQDLNSDTGDYRIQHEDDEFDEEQPDSPHGNLDEEVHRIAANLRRAAFCSCISSIEVEDDYTTLVKSIWGELRCFAQKPFVREVAIIAVVLLLKTSLFLAYREASKANLEIGNL